MSIWHLALLSMIHMYVSYKVRHINVDMTLSMTIYDTYLCVLQGLLRHINVDMTLSMTIYDTYLCVLQGKALLSMIYMYVSYKVRHINVDMTLSITIYDIHVCVLQGKAYQCRYDT